MALATVNLKDLYAHWGHEIELARYGDESVTIECMDCYEVLIDGVPEEEEEE